MEMHTARVLRSEKGCRIRITHVHACSDCVYTRNDTVRLNYASRFVRVVYSSHIVSIKLDTVTGLEETRLILLQEFLVLLLGLGDPGFNADVLKR